MSTNTLTPSMLITLGLTGVINTAVSCGPCLKYAPEDTADSTDTGDTGDTVDATPAADRATVRRQVLARGVLPDDVAALLAARARAHTRDD